MKNSPQIILCIIQVNFAFSDEFHSNEDEVIVIGETTSTQSSVSSESWSWSPPSSTQGGGWTPWTPTTTATTETNFANSSTVLEPLSGDYKVVCCKYCTILVNNSVSVYKMRQNMLC